jgi:hypothetical protein
MRKLKNILKVLKLSEMLETTREPKNSYQNLMDKLMIKVVVES